MSECDPYYNQLSLNKTLKMITFVQGTSASLIHYGFEKYALGNVEDDSGNDINGILFNGAHVTKQDSKCGAALSFDGGELIIRGQTLGSRGMDAITVAIWVKVVKSEAASDMSLFNIDSDAKDGSGAVIALEIKDGRIHWSHIDESGDVIFNLETLQQSAMPMGLWSHIAATYDSHKNQARLYIDSQFIKEEIGVGKMSSQFKGKISVGKGGSIKGLVDEFYLFQKALSFNDVKDLSELCDVDNNYPIPMENGVMSDLQLEKLRLGVAHRHSKVETNDGRDENKEEDTGFCKKQAVMYNTDIRGGRTAGRFIDAGDVTSIEDCVHKCCSAKSCHLAYMEKNRCFTVVCLFPILCQPVKVGKSLVSVGYVIRHGESVFIPGKLKLSLKTCPSAKTSSREMSKKSSSSGKIGFREN